MRVVVVRLCSRWTLREFVSIRDSCLQWRLRPRTADFEYSSAARQVRKRQKRTRKTSRRSPVKMHTPFSTLKPKRGEYSSVANFHVKKQRSCKHASKQQALMRRSKENNRQP